MPVPVTAIPGCSVVVVLAVIEAEPTAVVPVIAVAVPLLAMIVPVVPVESALALFSTTVPPWTTRRPEKVAELSAPRNKVPCPALISAAVVPTPVVRVAPDCVTAPMRFSDPAPAVAVFVVARMTPVPIAVGAAEPK